jgi:predicted dinucleotide-binding enzyme
MNKNTTKVQTPEQVTTAPMRITTIMEQYVAIQAEQAELAKALKEYKTQLLDAVKLNGEVDDKGRAVFTHKGNQAMIFPEVSYDALEKMDIVLTAVPKRYHRQIIKATHRNEYVKVTAVKE